MRPSSIISVLLALLILTAVSLNPVFAEYVGSSGATTSYPTTISGESCVSSSGFIYCVGGGSPQIQFGITDAVYLTSVLPIPEFPLGLPFLLLPALLFWVLAAYLVVRRRASQAR